MLAARYLGAAEQVAPPITRRRRTKPVVKAQPARVSLSRAACVGLLTLAVLCTFLVAYRNTALTQIGYETARLQSELAVLQRQNSELEMKAASLGSLARVEKLATTKLGMTRAESAVAIASLERSGGTVVAAGSGQSTVPPAGLVATAADAQQQGGLVGRLWDLLRRLAHNTVEAARSGK
jgi:cell division protein FtsL